MDYEKKYKEAFERARNVWRFSSNNAEIMRMEELFPELRESEGERIRKELMDFIDTNTIESDERRNRWFSYLEKYKPISFTSLDDTKVKMSLMQYISGLNKDVVRLHPGIETCNEWLSWLEKQGEMSKMCPTSVQDEQKPADKVEPKFKVKYAGSEYNVLEIKESAGVTYYGIEDEPNHIDYVKAENCEIISGYAIKENGSPYPTKPAVFSEKKPQRMVSAEAKEALYDKPTDEEMKELLRTEYEKGRADTIAEMEKDWSEEDDVMINKLLAVVKLYYDRSGDDLDKQSCISFLKSLKDKVQPQPKQEWSEEDEIARKALINLVEIYYGGCIDKTEKKRLLNLLKSLRPQNTWKPSEEQMSTLNLIISDYYHACTKECDKKAIVLKSILEQLKQL